MPAAACCMASAMDLGMGSVVSPIPKLMIFASGCFSWCARLLLAICEGTVRGSSDSLISEVCPSVPLLIYCATHAHSGVLKF